MTIFVSPEAVLRVVSSSDVGTSLTNEQIVKAMRMVISNRVKPQRGQSGYCILENVLHVALNPPPKSEDVKWRY